MQRLFPLAISLLLLVGCGGAKLLDLRGELSAAHATLINDKTILEKLNAESSNKAKAEAADAEFRLEETYRKLDEIALRSLEEGKKTGDESNKISFLQMAAVAAWVGNNTEILASVDDSIQDRCVIGTPSFNSHPRDCTMLLAIPHFAVVTRESANLQSIQRAGSEELKSRQQDINAWAAAERTAAKFNSAIALTDTFLEAIKDLTEIQKGIETTKVPQRFKDALQERTFKIACNADTALTALTLHVPTALPTDEFDATLKSKVDVWILRVKDTFKLWTKLQVLLVRVPNAVNCKLHG
ncbi:MAG: hypothetical protein O2967_05510 [Proteobacteria bacterium]|nr:hypothetical protein [Pseudomonadota bacterium]